LDAADRRLVLRRTARRYRGCGRFAYGYVAGKLRHDPVYPALLSLAAREHFGGVLDIGCGRGQLGIALLEAGLATQVAGSDRNGAHLRQAEQAATGLPFRAEARDLCQAQTFPDCDTVLLVDVCYQLDTNSQMQLLRAAARSAREKILIRTADPELGWRSTLTRGLEQFGRGFWPHSGALVNARPLPEIAAILHEAGFAITVMPCWQGTPFANVLMIARRT
jgi:SAM-dependent methyltransferase